jgi:hypothetical protein
MTKESNNELLVRIDERTKSMKEQNDKEHKEIMSQIDDLCSHVNDENAKMNKRICKLEDETLFRKGEKKGVRKVYKYATAILGLAVTALGILAGLNII